jgi:hypothetical protein
LQLENLFLCLHFWISCLISFRSLIQSTTRKENEENKAD